MGVIYNENAPIVDSKRCGIRSVLWAHRRSAFVDSLARLTRLAQGHGHNLDLADHCYRNEQDNAGHEPRPEAGAQRTL
jgi:hypothetical protein